MVRTVKKRIACALATALLATVVLPSAQPVQAVRYEGSETYMQGKYYQALQEVQLTGDARTDIVNVALSQAGYLEGTYFDELSGEICGNLNATEYGDWYGMQDQWCAIFVSWCAAVAGIGETVIPKHAYTPSGLLWFRNEGRAYSRARVAAGDYTPKPGDLIYFKSGSTSNPTNHVGLVTGYRNGVVYTIEGNTASPSVFSGGGAVAQKSYPITNTYIVYICSPDYGMTGMRVADRADRTDKIEELIRTIGMLETGDSQGYDRIGQSYDGVVTLGCGQWYGNEAKQLLLRIWNADVDKFLELDGAGVAEDLQLDWTSYGLETDSDKAAALRRVLGSPVGIQAQVSMMEEKLMVYAAEAAAAGIADVDVQLACAAVRYMGGSVAFRSVLAQVEGTATLEDVALALQNLGFAGAKRICDALI